MEEAERGDAAVIRSDAGSRLGGVAAKSRPEGQASVARGCAISRRDLCAIATGTWQRIEERFVRDPGGELESRL
jgi:hypothetical protein